jgi:hypothetical protein
MMAPAAPATGAPDGASDDEQLAAPHKQEVPNAATTATWRLRIMELLQGKVRDDGQRAANAPHGARTMSCPLATGKLRYGSYRINARRTLFDPPLRVELLLRSAVFGARLKNN